MAESGTVELTIRMLLGLVVVAGLLWGATRFASKRLKPLGATASVVVRGRLQLTRSSSVAVLTVGERNLLIGVNDHAVSLLAEGDDLVAAPVVDVRTDVGPGSGRPPRPVASVAAKAASATRSTTSSTSGPVRRARPGAGAGPASFLDALRARTVRRG